MQKLAENRTAWVALLVGATIVTAGHVWAQVFQSGSLVATQDCPATRAINGANPGNIRLVTGQRYELVGFNSQARTHALVKVPGATPEQRWVAISCGTLQTDGGGSLPSPTPTSTPTPQGLLPFFDRTSNPVPVGFSPDGNPADITPEPPELNLFDRAVLRTCGPMGTKLQFEDVDRLLTYFPDMVRKAKQVTGGELSPGRRSDAAFQEDLVKAWTDEEGFEHIFCGELEGPQKIGGLHFHGRYLQLQESGMGGRLANNSPREEVVPGVVYTLGVVIKTGNRTFTDDLKGYPYPTNGEEMFLETTRLYKLRRNIKGACIAPIKDRDSGTSYSAVFVQDEGIITFYPDATPKGSPCERPRAGSTGSGDR